MKVSLINASPYDTIVENGRRNLLPATWPPLGILYLATTLDGKGIDVSVLDQPAKRYTVEETVKWIGKEDPDILGFSTLSSSGRTATVISTEVKKTHPNILTILGGYYATFNAKRILYKYSSVDLIVRGEGEKTIVDLVDAVKKGEDLKHIPGIAFRDGDTVCFTPERPLIQDIDSIPFPNRHFLDEEYQPMIAEAKLATKKFTSILFSRGCVYRCRFCSGQTYCGNTWRPRSVKNIMKELLYLTSEGYQEFIFVDDNFTLNQKRVIELCENIRRENLDIDWICEGRVDNGSQTMFQEVSKAGCKVVFFGIESANQRILNYYDKGITPHQSKSMVNTARKAGIDLIVGSFILGAPDETREEIQNTLEFAKRLSIDFPRFNILEVTPGTDIWDELARKEILNEETYWETGISVPKISPKTLPFHEIEQMIYQAYREFLKRPSFIITQITRLLTSPYRMNLLRHNLNRLEKIKKGFQVVKRLD